MVERQDSQQDYVFKEVQLLKSKILGTGSYGTVCKAKCDELLCAAKLLYPVLSEIHIPDPDKEYRRPLRRFETECQFLSRINHPNIVQYLGTYRDPETNALVLLMELMDKSLTNFLELSPEDLPYHTQVNLSYDIAQALSFLHSNGIIHRDLSSNNILLLGSIRAKVTDFGMSRFADANTVCDSLATMTVCPGTPVFMSPEALDEPPLYTEKLDTFSFGVLLIQIATRLFPKPTDRFITKEPHQFSSDQMSKAVPVPELERRQDHIDLISPIHPLLPTAVRCLNENDDERPTAQQLCQTLTVFKMTTRYRESFHQDLHQLPKETKQPEDKQNSEMTVEGSEPKFNEYAIKQSEESDIKMLRQKLDDRDLQIKSLHCELKTIEKKYATIEKTLEQRDREVSDLRRVIASKTERSTRISLQDEKQRAEQSTRHVEVEKWQILPDIPTSMKYGSTASIGASVYFKAYSNNKVFEFSKNRWTKLPSCPNSDCPIVSVDGTLTAVGGSTPFPSSKLYSYVDKQWIEQFPPMPTERCNPAAVYASALLVVAGGITFTTLNVVEILEVARKQWSSVSSLPVVMKLPFATICGDCVYIHPRATSKGQDEKNLVYKCSLEQLVQCQPSSAIWESIMPLPTTHFSLVTVDGYLLAMGGREANRNRTNNVYQYINLSWNLVGHMQYPRLEPITVALPGNKLMVAGGDGASTKCELAIVT